MLAQTSITWHIAKVVVFLICFDGTSLFHHHHHHHHGGQAFTADRQVRSLRRRPLQQQHCYPSTSSRRRLVSTSAVKGMVEDFSRLQITHETITKLRRDIPLLLYIPYSEKAAEEAFTVETQLLVVGKDDDDYVLASSRDEMVALQNALLIAVQGPLRATNLLSRQNLTAPVINCRFLAEDDDASELVVEWSVKGALSNANISGVSQLALQDGKVATHRLVQVRLNSQPQDAASVGNAMSRIRKTVRSLQQTQSVQSAILPFSSMFSQYRDDLLRQLDITLPKKDVTAPLIFVDREKGNQTSNEKDSMNPPLPGTNEWDDYARAYEAVEKFVEESVPRLALAPPDATYDLDGLFLPEAEMIGLDGSPLIQGGPRLAKFYQSLASWRRRSLIAWTLEEASAVKWRGDPEIRVSFVIDLPGSEASLAGVDRYTIVMEKDRSSPRISAVHQESMSIGGNSKQQDLVLLMRGLVAAVENDRFANADEKWIIDLWQRLRSPNGRSNLDVSDSTKTSSTKKLGIPTRSDSASSTVYRIMMALHNEGRDLVDPTIVRNASPAIDFMIENVQLRGLINEVLLRGRSNYQQNIGFSIGSLRSSIRSKRVKSEADPETRVELTKAGNIRYSLTLFLKIETFPGLSNLLSGGGLPLKINLISDYILDPDSGRIVQHRLIESRVNDQLTPGDVLSRVLLRREGGASSGDSSLGRVVTEFLTRFVGSRTK